MSKKPVSISRTFYGNKIRKHLQAIGIMLMAAAMFTLTACGGTNGSDTTTLTDDPGTTADLQTTDTIADSITQVPGTDETFTIGIIQFAHHASLDNCYDGLIAGLASAGYVEGENLVIDRQNANADSNLANQIAANMVSRNVDMIVGIATPAAQAAYNAALETDIPVLFTAITDPILAGLADEDGSPRAGVTGTSDALPVEEQLQMIRAFFPDAGTIGILYSLSESNSISAIDTYRALAADYGFHIETEGVSEAQVIPAAADSLLSRVDVITNLTDNMIVENLAVILNRANESRIPYFGSEEEQVANGLIAAQGLDYYQLGEQTAAMGAQILEGTAPEDIPISIIEDASSFHNSEVMAAFEVELPAAYENSRDMAP